MVRVTLGCHDIPLTVTQKLAQLNPPQQTSALRSCVEVRLVGGRRLARVRAELLAQQHRYAELKERLAAKRAELLRDHSRTNGDSGHTAANSTEQGNTVLTPAKAAPAAKAVTPKPSAPSAPHASTPTANGSTRKRRRRRRKSSQRTSTPVEPQPHTPREQSQQAQSNRIVTRSLSKRKPKGAQTQ